MLFKIRIDVHHHLSDAQSERLLAQIKEMLSASQSDRDRLQQLVDRLNQFYKDHTNG